MQKNLVIVESPAKAKTIEKFLGDDYKVMSSYGHIRDLKKHELSINESTLTPVYEIPEEKNQVWLASDEDREGEAISWHLCEVLGLDEQHTKRIVFHEITKPAILEAIEHPRTLDMNLVDMANIAADGASASWSGNVPAPATVLITRRIGNTDQLWFSIDVNMQTYHQRDDEHVK